MRKDVRIGLAIAGVLVTLLVVYALVPKGGDEVALNTGDGQTETLDGTETPIDGATDPASDDSVTSDPAGGNEFEAGEDAFGPSTPDDAADETADSGDTATGDTATGETNWLRSLSSGEVVKVESHAPLYAQTVTPSADDAPDASADADDSAGADSSGTVTPLNEDDAEERVAAAEDRSVSPYSEPGDVSTGTEPSAGTADSAGESASAPRAGTAPAAGGSRRTHVVQRGETIVQIAEAVYGDQKYYPQILNANPDIDPNALRIGSVIVLPEINTSDASRSTSGGESRSGGGSEGAVNSASEYRVQPGDSLYKISLKLYGRSDRVDALYDLNKSEIGDDPARVRVGMVLKLPEAPTLAQSR